MERFYHILYFRILLLYFPISPCIPGCWEVRTWQILWKFLYLSFDESGYFLKTHWILESMCEVEY